MFPSVSSLFRHLGILTQLALSEYPSMEKDSNAKRESKICIIGDICG